MSMIQVGTLLKVADNTGAKYVKCIATLGASKFAYVGDCILVTVRSLRPGPASAGPKRIMKKGQIFKALVIRTRKGISNRKHGHSISFESNDVVLFEGDGDKQDLIGSRIFGPVTRELRFKGPAGAISKSKRMLQTFFLGNILRFCSEWRCAPLHFLLRVNWFWWWNLVDTLDSGSNPLRVQVPPKIRNAYYTSIDKNTTNEETDTV